MIINSQIPEKINYSIEINFAEDLNTIACDGLKIWDIVQINPATMYIHI